MFEKIFKLTKQRNILAAIGIALFVDLVIVLLVYSQNVSAKTKDNGRFIEQARMEITDGTTLIKYSDDDGNLIYVTLTRYGNEKASVTVIKD
jgi:hypothetical protein